MFQITEIEAAAVSVAVREMPEERAARLRARARVYREQRARMTGAEETWGSLPPEGSRLACPALEDGACAIYEHRPLICRKFGIPLWNPDRPGRVYACELNFRPGDAIEDGALIQIQTGLHERAKQLQRDYNEAGGYRDAEPLNVARAMVEDFRFAAEGRGPGDMLR
ncbi:MAG: hypothetical protein R2729_00260 [Bryobacteraceae bacterium]